MPVTSGVLLKFPANQISNRHVPARSPTMPAAGCRWDTGRATVAAGLAARPPLGPLGS